MIDNAPRSRQLHRVAGHWAWQAELSNRSRHSDRRPGGRAATDRLSPGTAEFGPQPGHGLGLASCTATAVRFEFKNVSLTYYHTRCTPPSTTSRSASPTAKRSFVGPNGLQVRPACSRSYRVCFEPQEGVLLDGQNIRDFSVRSLRRQIGVVTQNRPVQCHDPPEHRLRAPEANGT